MAPVGHDVVLEFERVDLYVRDRSIWGLDRQDRVSVFDSNNRIAIVLANVADKPGSELFGAQRTSASTFGIDPYIIVGALAVVFPIVITFVFIGRDP